MSDAFRETVAKFEGSVAIAVASANEPDKLLLALHGSGQGLSIGLAEDRFIVASEPYGVVEETLKYVRMDGEALGDPNNPSSRGQVATLSVANAGELEGIILQSYDGSKIALGVSDIYTAEITTRDINRGEHKHFYRKKLPKPHRVFEKLCAAESSKKWFVSRRTQRGSSAEICARSSRIWCNYKKFA